MARIESDPIDRDERLGEAIETYLELVEDGKAPAPETFADRYPDLGDDLNEALAGLALVRGLVGEATGPAQALEAGRRVAGYRIVRELGRGGMGVVYEAVHVDLDRPVALKVLGNHAAPDSNGRRRFLNEAKTAASLHHTHIVPVFDVGQVGGLCYYAMQRIEGTGLDQVIKMLRRDRSVGAGSGSFRSGRSALVSSGLGSEPADEFSLSNLGGSWSRSRSGNGPGLPERLDRAGLDRIAPIEPPRGSGYYRWVAKVGRMAAEALAHAHHRGVVHRDVKPSNLLVDARGTLWMADFGLARRLADPGLTRTDSLLGTPRYMSPEQARGDPVDGRSDVYSLGATLYELLTLRPPFEGQTAAELVQQILDREPTPPRKLDRRIPRDLETIVLKALAKRPADRYASALELAEDLARFLAVEPVRARRIGPLGRAWRFARRHPSLSAVSTTATVAVLAVATWAHLSVVQKRDEALQAKAQIQQALKDVRQAVLVSEAARREALWREAEAIRASTMPERRRRGLERLQEAAALGPESAMRIKLRDEAVEYLALRDVEARPVLMTGPTWGIAFTPEAGRLASLRDPMDETEGLELSLWDSHEGRLEQRPTLEHGPTSGALEFPPLRSPRDGSRSGSGLAAAGQTLAIVRADGQGIHLLSATTGAPIAEMVMTDRHIDGIHASPGNGRRLVTLERVAAHRLRAVLWDIEREDQPIATLLEPEPIDETVRGGPPRRDFQWPLVAFSPSGDLIATAWQFSGGAEENGAIITLWDPENGAIVGEIRDLPAAIHALALGPDGLVAAAVSDGTIRLWEGSNLAPRTGINHAQNFVRLLRFSPDGTMLAVAGSGTGIELWDPATSTLLATVRPPEPTASPERISDLAFSTDGRTLAASSGGSTALWAIIEPVGRVRLSGFEGRPTSLAFGPGDALAIASWGGQGPRVWYPGHCPTTARDLGPSHATALAFDDRGRVLSADGEGLTWLLPGAPESSISLAFEPTRRPSPSIVPMLAAGAGITQTPIIEALRQRPPRRSFLTVPIDSVNQGRDLALARFDQVFLWSADRPEAIWPLPPPDQPPASGRSGPTPPHGRRGDRPMPPAWTSLALAPGLDRLYLLSTDNTLHAWAIVGRNTDRLTTRPLPWSGSFAEIRAIALAPDGRTLVVGTATGDVHLIDTARGVVRETLGPEGHPDTPGPVESLAIAPDGRTLAVGGPLGRINLWSLAPTGRPAPLLHLPGHRGDVSPLTFSPDSRLLASAGDGKVVQVWDLSRIREQLNRLGLGW